MAQQPAHAPTLPDSNAPLIAIQKLLTDTADAITEAVIGPSPPANSDELRTIRDKIVIAVDKLGDIVLADVDDGIRNALGTLKDRIDVAKQTLKRIKQVQMMLNIAADILAAGVGVATGGVAGTGAVMTLIDDVNAAIEGSKKDDDAAGNG